MERGRKGKLISEWERIKTDSLKKKIHTFEINHQLYLKDLDPISWLCLPGAFYACDHHSWLSRQVQNFCASCVSEECLVTWTTHMCKQNFPAHLRNTLNVSTDYPASVSTNWAIKLGPDWSVLWTHPIISSHYLAVILSFDLVVPVPSLLYPMQL